MKIQRLDPDDARKTYRYLRIGLIGSTAWLFAAVAIEAFKAPDCFQTSISGYYYTPARAIFVGALVSVGVALIVIKGSRWEDIALNFAGILAPVVAFVPTANVGECWSIEPMPSPLASTEPPVLAQWVLRNIENNVWSFIAVGALGIVVSWVIFSISEQSLTKGLELKARQPGADDGVVVRRGLLLVVALLVAAAIALWKWDGFMTRAHGIAAVSMFAFLVWAAAISGRRARAQRQRNYSVTYFLIAAAMVGVALLVWLGQRLYPDWDHAVLVLEASEISLFAGYWIVQTKENWHETVPPPPGEQPTSP